MALGGEDVVDIALRPSEALAQADCTAAGVKENLKANKKKSATGKKRKENERKQRVKEKRKAKKREGGGSGADNLPASVPPTLPEPESELGRQLSAESGGCLVVEESQREEMAARLRSMSASHKQKKSSKERRSKRSKKALPTMKLESEQAVSQEEPPRQAQRTDGSAEDVMRDETAAVVADMKGQASQHGADVSCGSSGKRERRLKRKKVKKKEEKADRRGSKRKHRRIASCERKKANARDDAAQADFCGDFYIPVETTTEHFACLEEEEIVAQQSGQVETVADVLSVSTASAVALLKHFKWNKDKLLVAYCDHPAATLAAAGVTSDALVEEDMKEEPAAAAAEAQECSICAEEFDGSNCFALDSCKHCFCLDCWEQYLGIKIREGAFGELSCPHQGCGSLVPRKAVERLVDGATYAKFCQFLMHSFVDDNEKVRWCPAPNCGRAVKAETVLHLTVACACGHRFCFLCSEEDHLPATCSEVRLWKKKCQDESETNHWIAANTQECPKCQLPTEKNGGCNHMVCRQCKHEYCWVCFRDWKGHNDFYSCNRFEKTGKNGRSRGRKACKRERERERLEVKRELERYLHHYSRFVNHAKSKELEQIQEAALRRMREMQDSEATGAEVQFIEEAALRLRLARNMLKYSYVKRFFMQAGPEEELFAFVQQAVEEAAEELAVAFQAARHERSPMINLTQSLEQRCQGMVDASLQFAVHL